MVKMKQISGELLIPFDPISKKINSILDILDNLLWYNHTNSETSSSLVSKNCIRNFRFVIPGVIHQF